ncbi:MAG: YidC/Oxa1 family insertase periplasmic-domain containing protein [Planctomycetia bacterium]|nr:YidC/Oxa1 family insertase periplasmic-domain containing protein [Planctomycetia bacterium]
MDKRFVTFLVVAFGLLMGYQLLLGALGVGPKPQAEKPPAQEAAEVAAKDQPADGEEKENGDEPAVAAEAAAGEQPAPAVVVNADWPDRYASLGSLDPASPYQMLVAINSHGAAVERIELNQPRYGDLPQYDAVELKGGYIGSLAPADAGGTGVAIHVVGPGTPAAQGGLQAGDVITQIAGKVVKTPGELQAALETHEPGKVIELTYSRGGEAAVKATVTPIKPPLAVVRPEKRGEKQDPLSMLVDLDTIDGKPAGGVDLHAANWELSESTASLAVFRMALDSGLVIQKRYELVPLTEKEKVGDARGYELKFSIAVENPTEASHKFVYRLDGPTGLPTEGWWYGSKISSEWFTAAGIRDVVTSHMQNGVSKFNAVGAPAIAKNEKPVLDSSKYGPIIYTGVDAQYFSAVLKPDRKPNPELEEDPWFASIEAMRVGPVPEDTSYRKVVDTSFRLTSKELTVEPGKTLRHDFHLFAGPKVPDVLATYGLDALVEYGLFGWVARPMSRILHFFYYVTGNYGIAIIMLTVLVRSCMFPISRKQALGAQKMQMLQPEMKKIAEKHKTNPEQRMKAQQELFRKHNYNPLAGCLPLFLQLPIFIGLYRSLMVDVELRQAPLFPGVDWCSNLAAPDMLWNWSAMMPGFIEHYLGSHLNVLPLITVGLFLWQQKLFMPPATDPQQELQQSMMKYMMIFMAFMFYHVASGLCIYFIASSLWGIAERKLLPKTLPVANGAAPASDASGGDNRKASAVDRFKALFQNGKEETNDVKEMRRRRERGKRGDGKK